MATKLTRLTSGYKIKPFDCEDADLNDFLFNDAEKYLEQLLSVTYLLESDTDTIAFFSLLNDKIVEEDFDSKSQYKKFQKKHLPRGKSYKSYPAVKIARLGVNVSEQGNGTGKGIIDFLKQWFVTKNRTGCRFITVDAYKKSVGFYEKIGFSFFTSRDANLDTRAMYLELLPYVPLKE